MLTGKVFYVGGDQAVELPDECRFKGRKVGIINMGDSILLFPIDKASFFVKELPTKRAKKFLKKPK